MMSPLLHSKYWVSTPSRLPQWRRCPSLTLTLALHFFTQPTLSLPELTSFLAYSPVSQINPLPQVLHFSCHLFFLLEVILALDSTPTQRFWCKIWLLLAGLRLFAKWGNGFAPKATGGVLQANSNSSISARKSNNPIVVIDNYDSFTYNLCQVHFFWLFV